MKNKKRPKSVPETAHLDEAAALWREGDASSPRERLWVHPSGIEMLDAPRRAGKLHGEVRWHLVCHEDEELEPRVALQAALGLPDGPGSAFVARYEDGELVSVRFAVDVDMEDHLSVSLRGGKLHGKLDWKTRSLDGPLFTWRDITLDAKRFAMPKPRPHRVTALFADGELTEVRFFREDGAEVKANPPIAEWGQDMTAESLAGYLARGDLARDLARFFPHSRRIAPDEITPAGERFSPLPKAARAAADVLDDLVRSGTAPSMPFACSFTGYGFDCAENELYGADDPRYFGLAYDGYGDMYLLDLTTGAVLFYSHEEGELEPGFDSIDAFAFAMPRVDAAKAGLIPMRELGSLFERLGLAVRTG